VRKDSDASSDVDFGAEDVPLAASRAASLAGTRAASPTTAAGASASASAPFRRMVVSDAGVT
jgi:hypothetical protein